MSLCNPFTHSVVIDDTPYAAIALLLPGIRSQRLICPR